METLLKSLGIEESAVEAMDLELAKAGISENPIRLQWKKGMRFSLETILKGQVTNDKNEPTGNPFPLYSCSNGGTISPKHFQDVKNDPISLELSRKGLIRYLLAHKAGKTIFRVKDYTPAEGTFGTSGYTPTSFKIEVVESEIEDQHEEAEE